jgi:peptidoglycan/xylan/chitin deacetylase (PgdA/CDA1 family)
MLHLTVRRRRNVLAAAVAAVCTAVVAAGGWLSAACASAPAPAPAGVPRLARPAVAVAAGGAGASCRETRCIALTFDDGPGRHTAEVLAVLARHSARATFFVLGRSVAAHPELVRAEVAAGHEVGNHSWSHPRLPALGAAEISLQLASTDDAVRAATGRPPALFRPPYGLADDAVRRVAGRPVVRWNREIDGRTARDARRAAADLVAGAQAGDVVLLYDVRPVTLEVLPGILAGLSRRGFRFVTVSRLLAAGADEPPRGAGEHGALTAAAS